MATFRQDSGLAYSEYGAAFALFVETQHSRLYTTQAAWLTHPHIYTNISQSFVDIFTKYSIDTGTVATFLALHCVTGHLALWSDIYTKVSTSQLPLLMVRQYDSPSSEYTQRHWRF